MALHRLLSLLQLLLSWNRGAHLRPPVQWCKQCRKCELAVVLMVLAVFLMLLAIDDIVLAVVVVAVLVKAVMM